jgi:chlorite dismutase
MSKADRWYGMTQSERVGIMNKELQAKLAKLEARP